jgi:hypothetical protein
MKQKGRRLWLAAAVMVAAAVGSGSAGMPQAPGLDPESYPGMGREEAGQLRHFLAIADGPIPDFSSIRADDQLGDTAFRYSLAFMTYFLALEQYYKLPACPELIQPRMDRLIQKMVERPVWEYWARVSQGVPSLEPRLNRPYPEQHDPVADQNIMFSGHLGHMIGLYEMLYRDFKWDRPGSIVFVWNDTEQYSYDHHSLVKVLHDQMANNPWHGIACEPNAVFPSCNQHPVLAFILHDHLHHTSYAQANQLFLDSMLEHKILNTSTRHFAGYYLVKQDVSVGGVPPAVSPAMDGWAGAFMHAWQPELIERLYPYQRKYHLTFTTGKQARLNLDVPSAAPVKYGFFAILAAELGDRDTRDRLLASADYLYRPVWKDGCYYYPLAEKPYKVSFLTGVLLATARALAQDGLKTMHNQPFPDSHFLSPLVRNLSPGLILTRAIYDPQRKALIASTAAGQGPAAFEVHQLAPDKYYVLWEDGRERQQIHGREAIRVETSLDRPHHFILIEI